MRFFSRSLPANKTLKKSAFFAFTATIGSLMTLEISWPKLIPIEPIIQYENSFSFTIVSAIILSAAGYIFAVCRYVELREERGLRNIAETRAEWIAYHDFLTRLPNRRYLEEKAEQIIQQEFARNGYAVLAIDLDGFKKVNETVGPDGGDRLLVRTAQRLTDALPNSIAFRLGSDEFLVIAGCTECGDPQQNRDLADTIMGHLNQPMDIDGTQVSVGACIGLANFAKHSQSLKEVIKHAIVSLSVAKRQGRNSFVEFEPALDEDLARRARIEHQLRDAVRTRAIVPHYQPLIDLETGAIIGFEALARWTTSNDENISPDLFIRIAENCGLITELSESLLQQACEDAKSWPSHIHLAFNISPRMLEDRHLGLRLFKILGRSGLSPLRLEVEITESALVRDTDLAASIIDDLRDAGVRIALDDFGTGYSTLAQLSSMTFDKIKIDRMFVNGLGTDAKKTNIIRTVIALASGLGISTTAEGIEQQSQLKHLKKLGCTFGQGYLFGKAASAEDTLDLLKAEETARSARRRHA